MAARYRGKGRSAVGPRTIKTCQVSLHGPRPHCHKDIVISKPGLGLVGFVYFMVVLSGWLLFVAFILGTIIFVSTVS